MMKLSFRSVTRLVLLFGVLFLGAAELAAQERTSFSWYLMFNSRQGQTEGIYRTLYNDALYPALPHDSPDVQSVGATIGFEGGLTDLPFVYFSVQAGVNKNIYPRKKFEGGHFRLLDAPRLDNRIKLDQATVSLGALIGARMNPDDALCINLQSGILWDIAVGPYIEYNSTQPEFDAAVEQALNDGNRSRNNMKVPLYLSFDWRINDGSVRLQARGGIELGMVDVLRTFDNPFGWSDRMNRQSHFVAEIGLISEI